MLQRALPAVVAITTLKPTTGAKRHGGWVRIVGSGFVVDPDGIIVTNKHVIAGSQSIQVMFADGSHALATVIAEAVGDLAVLRVHMVGKLSALAFGDSDKLRIGEPVFTIGNALGVGISVSEGIISGLDRDIGDTPYDTYLQTDAVLNHGNSGGPLVNSAGEVVGVDTALISPTSGFAGLGFAIPSNDAQFVVQRLLKYGSVRAGWIGVQLQDLTARLADGLGLGRPEGGLVVAVKSGSPAANAGLSPGDLVTAVDGTVCANARQAMRAIGRTAVGQQTTLDVLRDGGRRVFEVAVAELPGDVLPAGLRNTVAAATAIANQPNFGLKVANAPATNSHSGSNVGPGVTVVAVDPRSAAGAAGIAPGDVVLRVGDTSVVNPADFSQGVEQARKLGRHYVLMLVQSKKGRRWVAVFSKPFAQAATND
jgi:serine protease Do